MSTTYRFRHLHHTEYARLLIPIFGEPIDPGAKASVANRVYLIPLQVERMVTVNRIGYLRGATWAPAGNVELGIYADNGDTPAGGALLATTGALGVGVGSNRIFEVAIGPITLTPGLYWLAQTFSAADAGMCRGYGGACAICMGGTLISKYYDPVGFGLVTPCPAVTDVITAANCLYARLLVSDSP